MGHQVNYYALYEDFARIESKLRSIEPMVILHSRSPTATPRIVPALNFRDEKGIWLFCHLVREADLHAVMTEYVSAQGYWTIDVLRSPVIECDGCFFDGKILRRGRMYYTDGDYDANRTWVEKPEGFRRWASAILRATKKCIQKLGSRYIGPEAAKWLETSGGKLVD